MMVKVHASSISKDHIIKEFNARYLNPEAYEGYPEYPTTNWIEMEDYQRDSHPDLWFDDVIKFCKNTDVCKQYGLSLKDLLSMEYSLYIHLKEIVIEDNDAKAKKTEAQSKEIERHQQSLMENMKDG